MKSKLVKRSYLVFVTAVFLFTLSLLSTSTTFASELSDLIAQGDKYFQADDYTKAVEYYEKAVELDPNNYMVWLNMGFSLAELERYDESIMCYRRAKEVGAPESGPLSFESKESSELYNKALWSYKSEEKIAYYEKIIGIEPLSAGTMYYCIGHVYKDAGNIKKAEEYFKKAIKSYPLHETSYGALGWAFYDNSGPSEKIVYYFSIHLVMDPDSKYREEEKKIIEDLRSR